LGAKGQFRGRRLLLVRKQLLVEVIDYLLEDLGLGSNGSILERLPLYRVTELDDEVSLSRIHGPAGEAGAQPHGDGVPVLEQTEDISLHVEFLNFLRLEIRRQEVVLVAFSGEHDVVLDYRLVRALVLHDALFQRAAFMVIVDKFKVPPQNQTYASDGFDITAVKDLFNFLLDPSPTDFDQQFSTYFLNEKIVWNNDANGARLISRSNAWDAQVRVNANPAVLNGWNVKTILCTGAADGTVSSNGTRRAFNTAGGAGNRNRAFFELPGMPHCVDIGTGGDNPPLVHWRHRVGYEGSQ